MLGAVISWDGITGGFFLCTSLLFFSFRMNIYL